MYFLTSVHAYDALDLVHVVSSVRAYPEGTQGPSSTVFECTTTIPGTGETDPALWLKDALIGLIEAL